MKLTIVPGKESVIGKAAEIAAHLKKTSMIQLYDFSTEVTGLDLTLQPPTADIVRDKGGYDAYLAEVDAAFTGAGFKRFEAPKAGALVGDAKPPLEPQAKTKNEPVKWVAAAKAADEEKAQKESSAAENQPLK